MKPKYKQARAMRKNLTPPEFLLWSRIKIRQPGDPVFRRQEAIGPYIADFYCSRAKLIVEVDGAAHDNEERTATDAARDQWLKHEGFHVYRIPAADIFADVDGIADGVILLALERWQQSKAPHRHSATLRATSPTGGGV